MCSGLLLKVLATLQIITLLPLLAHAGISKCGKWPYSYAGEMTPGGLSPQDLSDFDFVVIGGGLSGSIISKRLSENDRWKILVLEAGGSFGRKPNQRAFLYADQSWTSPYYRRPISWRRGAYNLGPMRWVYGLPEDYDTWLDMGNEDWGWDDVEPYFELTTKQSDDVATIQGYMELSEIGSREYDHALADIQRIIFEAYIEELASKGKAVNPERTVRDYEVKYATQKVGVHRCNVRVIKFAEVVSINLDESGKSVNSVTFVLRGNRTLEAKFRKELILAAGPIDSAKLLMLSGIGPASNLTSLGITVKHDLPVGLGLEDHHYVPLLFEVPDLPYEFPRVLQNVKLTTLYERDLFGYQGEHIFSTFYGVNLTGSPSLNDGTVELQYFYITRNDSLSLKEWKSHFRLSAEYEDILTGLGANKNLLIVHVVLSHPVSKGIVKLSSKNYMDTPMVSTNFLQNSDDLRTIVSGMRFVYEMVNTSSFKEKGVKYLHKIVPGCGYKENSDAEWTCIADYYLASQYDHAGTVKMGPMGHGGCVDNHLRLNGVDNLRVIGSSVIPRLPSGEVGASAAMIAERAADFIKVRWGGRPRYM